MIEKIKDKFVNLSQILFNLKKNEINTNIEFTKTIDLLRSEIATLNGYKTKTGELDLKKVKTSLLKEALLVHLKLKENKRENDYNEFVMYLNFLKDDKYKLQIEQLNQQNDIIEENKSNFKEKVKTFDLEEKEKEVLEVKALVVEDVLEIVKTSVKEKTKEYKDELLNKKKKNKNEFGDKIIDFIDTKEIKEKIK